MNHLFTDGTYGKGALDIRTVVAPLFRNKAVSQISVFVIRILLDRCFGAGFLSTVLHTAGTTRRVADGIVEVMRYAKGNIKVSTLLVAVSIAGMVKTELMSSPCGFDQCSCADHSLLQSIHQPPKVIHSTDLVKCLSRTIQAQECPSHNERYLVECEWGGMSALFQTSGHGVVKIYDQSMPTTAKKSSMKSFYSKFEKAHKPRPEPKTYKYRKKRSMGPQNEVKGTETETASESVHEQTGQSVATSHLSKENDQKQDKFEDSDIKQVCSAQNEKFAKSRDELVDIDCETGMRLHYSRPTCVCKTGCKSEDGACVDVNQAGNDKDSSSENEAHTRQKRFFASLNWGRKRRKKDKNGRKNSNQNPWTARIKTPKDLRKHAASTKNDPKPKCRSKEMWATAKDTLMDIRCGTFAEIRYKKPTCVCDGGCRTLKGTCVSMDEGMPKAKSENCPKNEVWSASIHEVFCASQLTERQPGKSGCQCKEDFARDTKSWECVKWASKCMNRKHQCSEDILAVWLKKAGYERDCREKLTYVGRNSCRCVGSMRRHLGTGKCVHQSDCPGETGGAGGSESFEKRDCPDDKLATWSSKGGTELTCDGKKRIVNAGACRCTGSRKRDMISGMCVEKKECPKPKSQKGEDCGQNEVWGSSIHEVYCTRPPFVERKLGRAGCMCAEGFARDAKTWKCVNWEKNCKKSKRNTCPGDILATEDPKPGFETRCDGSRRPVKRRECRCVGQMRRNQVTGTCVHRDECPIQKPDTCITDPGTEFSSARSTPLYERTCDGLQLRLTGPACYCNAAAGMRRNGETKRCIHQDECPRDKKRRRGEMRVIIIPQKMRHFARAA